MITLTNVSLIKSVLGGTATVGYDKFILLFINLNSVTKMIQAQIRITSTSQPDMQAITGSLSIDPSKAILTIEVSQLDFYRQIKLTTPQNDFATALVRDTQNSLETGLITLGVIAGVQVTGD